MVLQVGARLVGLKEQINRWQAYDAYARVSLFCGANSLLGKPSEPDCAKREVLRGSSQEVSKRLGSNGLFHLLINGVYWGDNSLSNLLLTSWDIQVKREVHP